MMKELKTTFDGKGQVKGYLFSQISRTNCAYLYEVRGNNTIHYEVFKRRENSMYDVVSYPSNKAFGVWAWTTSSLERANEIFNNLNTVTNEAD